MTTGGGGVKNQQKKCYVIFEWPLKAMTLEIFFIVKLRKFAFKTVTSDKWHPPTHIGTSHVGPMCSGEIRPGGHPSSH